MFSLISRFIENRKEKIRKQKADKVSEHVISRRLEHVYKQYL